MRFKFVSLLVLITILLFLSIETPVQGSRPPQSLLQETYPIESSIPGAALEVSETYPFEEVSTPQPTPNVPFIYNPALVTKDTIGVLSSGELINRNEEIELFKLEHTNAEGLVEVPPFIPPRKGVLPFPSGISNDPSGGVISPDAVIGTDDRMLVVNLSDYLPYSAIVFLEIKWGDISNPLWCTGWLVGPSSVVTAAHCIHDYIGHPTAPDPEWVKAYTGRSTGSVDPMPYMMCPEFDRWFPPQWKDEGQSKYWDYGVYRLACRVGDYSGYFGFMERNDYDQLAELAGYPQVVNSIEVPIGSMFTVGGNVTTIEPTLTHYNNDATHGQSGSPVWELEHPSCLPCVVSVHVQPCDEDNCGPRVTTNFFVSLIYERFLFNITLIYLPLVIQN